MSKKILIIEDDQDLRRALNVRLRANNYTTCFASDAVMAMSQMRREQPDLVLLDIGLPGGDGFMVLERMKNVASTGCIPVIVLSARDPFKNREQALQSGAQVYLQKPVDNDELLGAIRNALGEEV